MRILGEGLCSPVDVYRLRRRKCVRLIVTALWYGFAAIFISSLPAMGWTGETFRDYRCWYVTVFPSVLLIIVSVLVLSVITLVCVLYILILRSAVKTVDRIRDYRESNRISYVNKAFRGDGHCGNGNTETKVTITLERTTEEFGCSVHQVSKLDVHTLQLNVNNTQRKVSKISVYVGQAKVLNSNPSKLKAVKTVLIVILCFVGTWAPYYVTIILYVKCDIISNGYKCVQLEFLTIGPLFLLGVCNCLCDPIIYAWRHSGFKRTLRKMYMKYVLSKNLVR